MNLSNCNYLGVPYFLNEGLKLQDAEAGFRVSNAKQITITETQFIIENFALIREKRLIHNMNVLLAHDIAMSYKKRLMQPSCPIRTKTTLLAKTDMVLLDQISSLVWDEVV